MNNPYQVLSIANMVLFGGAMAGVLIIVWIGWLCTRHIGYLVLAAWALASMAGLAISYFQMLAALAGNTGGYETAQKLMLWLHLLRVIVTSLLLLAGMGLPGVPRRPALVAAAGRVKLFFTSPFTSADLRTICLKT